MSVTTPGWQQCIQQLLAAPTDSYDRQLGEDLADADDDKAWTVLIDVIDEDPPSSHPYQVAARTIGHLVDPVVPA